MHPQYRLPDCDYSKNGAYFVTICTKNRGHIFGEIKNTTMKLSPVGKIAQEYWLKIPDHFWYIKLHEFIIMPNHIHGIIIIDKSKKCSHECSNGRKTVPRRAPNQYFSPHQHGLSTVPTLQPQPESLSIVIRNYKAAVTTYARRQKWTDNIWQNRFYDRVIRQEEGLEAIAEYIKTNPLKWKFAYNNPENLYI